MRRFFISPESIKDDIALIVGSEAHHILDVLRLKKGDRLKVFDGQGMQYQGKIIDTAVKQVKVRIESVQQDLQVSGLEVTLVQALPKKQKMDYIVEKATELGVDTIIPTQTARTIVKLDKARQDARQLRWQKIAKEAAKQCGRATIPQIRDLVPWPDVLATLGNFDLKLLFSLTGKPGSLKHVLHRQKRVKRIVLFIGPEGDFTPEEVHRAEDSGCTIVSLGKTVLKSDTASICALAMVNYELRQ